MYSIQESEKETGAIIKLQKCLIIFFQKKLYLHSERRRKQERFRKRYVNIWVGIKNEQWSRSNESRRAPEHTSAASSPNW